ncbi:MAG: putative Ig domain-containing protein, partial [Blastocatellia bacterium]|nr:putative Ig domain-containing protein [Blastocatellia bacterium]
VTVTFTLAVGTNGASGSFPGNQTTATATTDANGVATSPIVTANGKIGTHNPTAQVAGVGTLANYVLNNIVGDPAGITAVGNSNQTTQVLTQFINPLKALVTDLAGNPVPNATVTFVIGTAVNGASGSFTGGVTTIVLTTGPDGTVTTALITANGNLGSYTVTATVNAVATPLTYTLTNLVGNPAGIAVIGTSTQVTNILTPFGNPLQALVTDLAGNPVPNVRVTFTLPTTQPNGTFPGQTSSASVPTNSAGIATSPIITASSQTGTYTATGAADGVNQNLTYILTNISDPAGSILAIGESEQTTVVTTAFVRPLQVLVIDNRGNPVNNVPVTFTMDNSRPNGIFRTGSTTAIVNTGTDGIATSPIVVANSIVGSYGVTATVSGVPTVLRFKLNNICSTITVSPEVLPDAIFGTPYQVVLKVTDSVNGKVSLSIQNQSGLATIPPGMTLDPVTGMLAGNPTQSGVFTFTIVASNEFGCSTTKDFNLAVKDPNCEELPFEPRDLEDGKVGRPYNVALLIGGNAVAPFIFEIANGKLPNGLLMDRTTGLISGLPTIAGNFTFTVVVKAANGCTGTKVYFIRICAVEHKPIFVADVGNNRVQRSDDGGATWTIVGGPGNGLGQFNAPAGIETNAMGTKIFVSDTGNNRIQRSLDSGRTWEIIADFGTKVGQVNSPVGLAYDENNDKLYVADTENSRVQVLDQAGSEKVGVFKIFAGATEGEKVGKMSKPKDVAVTCDGVVYVADTSNNRVQMNATGDRKDWKIFAGATQGRKIGKFRLPTGVFVDTRNVVYVADTANDRVQVNSSASESGWTVMFDNSQALGNVKAPQGVTVTDNGEVFVTDTNNNRLRRRVIDGDNNQITSSGEGQFVNPVGIR